MSLVEFQNEPLLSTVNKIPSEKAFVVIDRNVYDYQFLVSGVVEGNVILLLDTERNGIEQITAALSLHADITSIHIVSHGSPGCLYLGNSQLSLDTLEKYRWQLKTWFSQFSFNRVNGALWSGQQQIATLQNLKPGGFNVSTDILLI